MTAMPSSEVATGRWMKGEETLIRGSYGAGLAAAPVLERCCRAGGVAAPGGLAAVPGVAAGGLAGWFCRRLPGRVGCGRGGVPSLAVTATCWPSDNCA